MKNIRPRVALIGMDAVSLKLVRKYLSALPNFRKLIARGSANEAIPCLPAYTPTNWATIATGAWPGTHGAGLWHDNKPGDPAGKARLSTFNSRAITAEFIWEAAERQGLKCLLVHYPGAYPTRTKKAMIVTPLQYGLSSLTMLGGANYSTGATNPDRLISLTAKQGYLEGKILLFRERDISKFHSLSDAERAKLGGATEDGAGFQQRESMQKKPGEPAGKVFTLYLRIVNSGKKGYNAVEIYCKSGDKKPLAKLREGEWSDRIIIGGAMRFKLRKLSKDGRNIELLRSEVYPVKKFTYPESLSKELFEKFGSFFEHNSIDLWQDPDTCIEEMEYQVDWTVKTAKYLLETKGWDLYYLHWHFPDSVLHSCLAQSDPVSPGYEPSKARAARYIIKRCLILGDRLLGGFMKMLDKNDCIAVVSDHGNSTNMVYSDVDKYLKESGLLNFYTENKRIRIEWDKTRAYNYGGLQIAINLKGREPYGIVDPEDYTNVQEEIIDALYNWKDENGKRVICLALKRKEAQMLGYWGDRLGDVYYLFNSGYGWGPVPGANHGPQSPFASTEMSSNLAMFVIAGPDVRSGHSRNPEEMGYIRLVDVVPTLCHILRINPPRNSQGVVIYDLFKGGKR